MGKQRSPLADRAILAIMLVAVIVTVVAALVLLTWLTTSELWGLWSTHAFKNTNSISSCLDDVNRLEAKAEEDAAICALRIDEGFFRRLATMPAIYNLSAQQAKEAKRSLENISRQIQFIADTKYGVASQRHVCETMARSH